MELVGYQFLILEWSDNSDPSIIFALSSSVTNLENQALLAPSTTCVNENVSTTVVSPTRALPTFQGQMLILSGLGCHLDQGYMGYRLLRDGGGSFLPGDDMIGHGSHRYPCQNYVQWHLNGSLVLALAQAADWGFTFYRWNFMTTKFIHQPFLCLTWEKLRNLPVFI